MTRLSQALEARKKDGVGAAIFYIVAGDPDLNRTVEIALALEKAGAAAIELGIPFSDPLADGPVIQAASQRALDGGMSVANALECVRRIRERSQIPIVLMTYYNPALQYGIARFAQDAKAAGADGVIQTDLTPEEAEEWIAAARAVDLDTVFLLAPTSTDERIQTVAKIGSGFLYCVSRTGVTGARSDVPTDLQGLIDRIRAATSLPICVGFGISSPDSMATICSVADGGVIGSALVQVIAEKGNCPDLPQAVEEFARPLVEAGARRG